MKKAVLSLILGIMLIGIIGFVVAPSANIQTNSQTNSIGGQQENLSVGQQLKEEVQTNTKIRKELKEEVRTNIREKLKEGEEINFTEKRIILKKINSEIMELRTEEVKIKTRLVLNNEGNASKLKARLSNGRNAIIKIMPNVASTTALQRLKLKICDETRNCSIELKEVGKDEQIRLVYEARARKTFRIFGFIKNRAEVRTQIDAETGEEIETKRPWWAWLASEKE